MPGRSLDGPTVLRKSVSPATPSRAHQASQLFLFSRRVFQLEEMSASANPAAQKQGFVSEPDSQSPYSVPRGWAAGPGKVAGATCPREGCEEEEGQSPRGQVRASGPGSQSPPAVENSLVAMRSSWNRCEARTAPRARCVSPAGAQPGGGHRWAPAGVRPAGLRLCLLER